VAYGDETIEAVARERGRALVAYAYLLTGDLPEAEGLVQHALVRTVLRPRAAADPATAEAEVRRTLLVAVAAGRRRRGPHAPAAARTPAHEALLALPPAQRVCVVLHDLDGLPPDRIGGLLDLSTGTVRSHLADARLRMGSPAEAAEVRA
jgi:RNA polymerase sigma-70 factor (ECF subfamily)